MIIEIWKPIPGFSKYLISNIGSIKNLCGIILRSHANTKGYLKCGLINDNNKRQMMRISRVVAITFIPNPLNLAEVNHIDGNKLNNSIENLEWCTHSNNVKHAYDTELKRKRCSYEIAELIRRDYKLLNLNYYKLGLKYNLSKGFIGQVIRGEVYGR